MRKILILLTLLNLSFSVISQTSQPIKFPNQAGQAGTFLTTNGVKTNWALVPLTSGVAGTLPFANGGTGITTATDTRIFFSDGANTIATNSGLNYQKTTTAAGGVLQLGGNTYVARTGLAMTSGSSSFYVVGDIAGGGAISLHGAIPTASNFFIKSFTGATVVNAPTGAALSFRIGDGSSLMTISETNNIQSTVAHNFLSVIRGGAVINPLIITPIAGLPTVDFSQGYIFNAGNNVGVNTFAGTYSAVRSGVHFGTTNIVSTAATVFSDYASVHIKQPVASTNVTITNSWSVFAEGQSKFDDIKIATVGSGLYVKEGTNATMGVSTLSVGTVTIATTKVTANSRIFLTVNGGTLTNVGFQYVSARTAGTSFVITSMNVSDASTVAWIIIEPN